MCTRDVALSSETKKFIEAAQKNISVLMKSSVYAIIRKTVDKLKK
jgi:hypothetical protein